MRSLLFALLLFLAGVGSGVFIAPRLSRSPLPLVQTLSPTPTPEPERPLLRFTIPALRTQTFGSARIQLDKEPIDIQESYAVHTFTAQTLGRNMSGVVHLPSNAAATSAAVLMLRGYVPPTAYAPGTGTKNAAAAYAKAGFITVAPDFFGYGTSDPEPTDEWQARFEKPIAVIEILRALRETGIMLADGTNVRPSSLGLWGHSNGGQIALSALSITGESIPTVLWAPVTAPFPYSILYFSDEEADEGQASRRWIAGFDRLYDARMFSFTNYLDGLRGPIMLHQGTNDDAVLKWWSDEFLQKVDKENERRIALAATMSAVPGATASDEEASVSAEKTTRLGQALGGAAPASLSAIKYTYHLYAGADHNMRPDWNTVVERDIAFFSDYLLPHP